MGLQSRLGLQVVGENVLTETQRKLQDALWKARRLNFEFVTESSLFISDGYWIADEPLQCHPLEAILLGEMASGSWREDASRMLGVTLEWITGFEAAFADRQACQDVEPDHRIGFRDGTTTRERLGQTAFVFATEPMP